MPVGVDKGDILWYSRMRKNTRGWDTKADTNGFSVAASHSRSRHHIGSGGAVEQEQQRTALQPQAILHDTFSNFASFLVGPRGLEKLGLSPSASPPLNWVWASFSRLSPIRVRLLRVGRAPQCSKERAPARRTRRRTTKGRWTTKWRRESRRGANASGRTGCAFDLRRFAAVDMNYLQRNRRIESLSLSIISHRFTESLTISPLVDEGEGHVLLDGTIHPRQS